LKGRRAFLSAAAAAPLLWHAGPLLAANASRVALVVGNNEYRQSPLVNAANDARGVAALLTQAGFAVDLQVDATRERFIGAIERFGKAAAESGVETALFYYAGHGLQIDWKNYLLPIDATVRSGADVKSACVDFDLLLGKLTARNKTLLVILDACRDNPFGGDYRADQKGLSPFDAPVGSLIAYSTAPGRVAADGTGEHGLYTENLIRELSVREQKIEDALKRVRLNVRLASRGAQVPWESTSLESDVFLFPAARKLSEAELERSFERELADWSAVKGSRKVDDWVAYLRRYPQGKFSEIAQGRLNRLLAEIEPAPIVAVAAAPLPVEAKPGAPVPKLWTPSPNPYSAGSYPIGRTYTVGDESTFRESDALTGLETKTFTLRVTRVDPLADRIEFNDGDWVGDTMGNMQKTGQFSFGLPVQIVPAELQVGKKWSTRMLIMNGGELVDEADVNLRVTGVENVSLPIGRIDAFRIESGGHMKRGRQFAGTYWVVPGMNAIYVKRELVVRWPTGQYQRTERHELVSHRQAA
jgi:hypothetical protein